jgi:hypothetical protein
MRGSVSRNHAGAARFLVEKLDRAVEQMDAALRLSDTVLRRLPTTCAVLRSLNL